MGKKNIIEKNKRSGALGDTSERMIMKIIDIINQKQDFFKHEPATLAFLGDSVTQGCFEIYVDEKGSIDTVFERGNAYSTRLGEMLSLLYPRAQVNIINSGLSGDNAKNGFGRIERDILPYHPDLTVVSYGLNDCCGGPEKLDTYISSLKAIFEKLREAGSEIIFLTECTMNSYVHHSIKEPEISHVAQKCAEREANGYTKLYFDAAKELCKEMGVTVCDCYSAWTKMRNGGVDTTSLLSNKVNHPCREMHYYMAIKLLETMFEI